MCKRKPLFSIRITDIIRETGYSQGAIYRYYKDIDEIIIALLNQMYSTADYSVDLEHVFEQTEKPEQLIEQALKLTENYISQTLLNYQKLCYELSVLQFSDPVRYEKIMSGIEEPKINESIINQIYEFIERKTAQGYFAPKLPLEDIISFIAASYDGIIRDLLLSKCYNLKTSDLPHVKFEEHELLGSLKTAVLLLLNITNQSL